MSKSKVDRTDFRKFSKAKGLRESTFPFAEKGLTHFRKIFSTLGWLFLFSVLAIVFRVIRSLIPDTVAEAEIPQIGETPQAEASPLEALNLNLPTELLGSLSIESVKTGALGIADASLRVIVIVFASTAVIFAVKLALHIVAYAFLTVRRWRYFERETLMNDFRAERLRRRLIGEADARERLSNAKARVKDEDSREGNRASIESKSTVEALKIFCKMKVRVNTRQNKSGNQISRRYEISFKWPSNKSVADELFKLTEGLDDLANTIEAGDVSFGERVDASDRSKLSFEGVLIVKDKYAFEVSTEDTSGEVYEYSFPLTLLIDRRAKRQEMKELAEEWANSTASALDNLLTTAKSSVKRSNVVVGASTALFEYDMAFSMDLSKTQRLGESLDSVFKTSGCDVAVVNGKLQVTIPLPSDLSLPIDVGEMYRGVFGKDAA